MVIRIEQGKAVAVTGWTKSAPHRDRYLHKRPTSMSLVGFEPAIPAIERPQTYALERRVTGIGRQVCL
jgi:hypothetical protein